MAESGSRGHAPFPAPARRTVHAASIRTRTKIGAVEHVGEMRVISIAASGRIVGAMQVWIPMYGGSATATEG